MRDFISAVICGPDGKPSLVNTVSLGVFILFAAVTLYLVWTGQPWDGYTAFAGVTCGGGLAGKVGDKYINNVCAVKATR